MDSVGPRYDGRQQATKLVDDLDREWRGMLTRGQHRIDDHSARPQAIRLNAGLLVARCVTHFVFLRTRQEEFG
jgi:hypothetical protein